MHGLISRIEANIYRIFCDLYPVWTQKSLPPFPPETAVKLCAYL
jgi:hypothetical protein